MTEFWIFLHLLGLVMAVGPGLSNLVITRTAAASAPSEAAVLRRLPPILVIHGGGVLYRLGCRAVGRDPNRPMSEPGGARPLSTIPWASRLLDRVLETGRLPWERTPDPELERPAMAAGSGAIGTR